MPEQDLQEQIAVPNAAFYNVQIGPEEYEVEAYNEEHAWVRALAEYRRTQAKKGLTVVVQKIADL